MPTKRSRSYADLLWDWQGLLDEIGERLPGLDHERVPLSAAMREIQELREIQKGLVGARRKVTERLGEVKTEGRDSARRLKGLVTWKLGVRKREVTEAPAQPERTRSGK